jgi:hypothetical protein
LWVRVCDLLGAGLAVVTYGRPGGPFDGDAGAACHHAGGVVGLVTSVGQDHHGQAGSERLHEGAIPKSAFARHHRAEIG